MMFWQTTYWTMISVVARLSSQFFVAKVIALFAGAAAFGVFGQFQSFVTIVQLFAGGFVSGGVTKYVAEYHDKPDVLRKLIQTAICFAFLCSLVTGFIIIIFSITLSTYIFHTSDYSWVLIVFGFTLFGYTLNQVFLSVFNGLNKMSMYAGISVAGAFFSMILICSLTYAFYTEGALLGLVLSQACLFLVGCLFIYKIPIQIKLLQSRIDSQMIKKLLTFSVMAIVSAISVPIVQILLRNYVSLHNGWIEVGYWQAMLRISDAYLMLITTIITTYALPKYSKIKNKVELKKEVFSLMTKLMPLTLLLAISIYLFRHKIIIILFSEKFIDMEQLFIFQLIGDVIKVGSWIIANVLLAKAKIKIYIFTELFFISSFYILSLLFFNLFGLIGLTMAFALNFGLYFVFILIWFMRYIKE